MVGSTVLTVTGSILNVAIDTARDLLMEEGRFLHGVRFEVEEIERELRRMKVFLEYADDRQDEDELIRQRVEEIRKLANEVEVVLETFANKVKSTKKRKGVKIALKVADIFNKSIALHKVGSEIVSIRSKITNLTNSLPIFDLTHLKLQAQSSDSTHEEVQRWKMLTFPQPEKYFLGMEEDIKQLVFHLVNDEGNQRRRRVVSICGMGGLGKTSLAKIVYNHYEVRRCFDRFAWVCINQRCQPRHILQEILTGLDSENTKIADLTDQQLVWQLYQIQENNKCLVVIDDIWSIDAWDTLKHAFPYGETQTCSKVLLTTRYKEVALHSDPSWFLSEPQCLTEVMESTDTKKNGKRIEQASAEIIDRIFEVPESSQTASLREHVSSEIVGFDGHGSVQNFWLGPSPTEIFSKHLRQYDAIKKINEVQAAKIEMMEAEIQLWKERNDLMEKKVQNIENHMLSRDSMTDLPLDAHSNSRQVPDASSANQPSLAAEVEPMHQEYSSSNATPSISNEVKSLTKKVKKKHAITAIPKVLKKVTLAKFL